MKTIVHLALGSALALTACSKPNPYYCEGQPDNLCASTDGGPMGCDDSTECTDSKAPVCDTSAHVCVACSEGQTAACTDNKPVCSNHECVACTSHDQCDSNVCLFETGACGTDANVAYATPSGNDTNPCTFAQPCQKITTAASKGKPYIKLAGSFDEAVLLDGIRVHIMADAGTTLTRSAVGPVLELRGTSTVTIDDLIIRGAAGPTGSGVLVTSGQPVNLTMKRVAVLDNAAKGIDIAGGSVTLSRCVVSGNTGGGALISATLDITNSLFVTNGSNTSTVGGITVMPAGQNDFFRFNTIANNSSSSGTLSVRGLNCAIPMAVSNSIVAGNKASTNCTFTYSLFDSGTGATGTNKEGDPKFKATDATMPLVSTFFRIANDSAAIDSGDPQSNITLDIDGDNRSLPDIGADEYR